MQCPYALIITHISENDYDYESHCQSWIEEVGDYDVVTQAMNEYLIAQFVHIPLIEFETYNVARVWYDGKQNQNYDLVIVQPIDQCCECCEVKLYNAKD